MFNSMPNMPSITPLQIVAFLTFVVTQALAYGWIKHAPNQETLSGAGTIISIGLAWADAHLRGKRVIAHAMIHAANTSATANTATAAVVTPGVSQPLGI